MKDDYSHEVWKEIQSEIELDAESTLLTSSLHPGLAVGLGGFFLLNVTALLSLPPVLKGRGAPYLPSLNKKLNIMFTQLRKDSHIVKKLKEGKPLTFVDLGSGDGRVVFRAAREGIFQKSIGYEINPLLHVVAQSRRLLQAPKYWTSTQFMCRDLWYVDLTDVTVVAVYGLNPIMKELGKKLQKELQPGSVVLSNVFSIPNWKASPLSSNGVFVYSVPSCWNASSAVGSKRTDRGNKSLGTS